MNILYIIGNGFDLNMGLRSSYTDFYNYYNSLECTKDNVKFLRDSISKDYQTWADLELGLGEFTTKIKSVDEFNEIFEDITDELATYLEKEENSFDFSQVNKGKFYSDLCFPENYLTLEDLNTIRLYKNKWNNAHWKVQIITLNYTRSIEKIINSQKPNLEIGTHFKPYNVYLSGIEHLHGFVDERMILGVNDISQVKNENFHESQEVLEALVKPICNSASRSTVDKLCEAKIKTANMICIFGCSIGDTDNIWWQQIGEQLKKDIRILIFTRGAEISRRRPYKGLPHERQIKKYFLDKTSLTDSEKQLLSKNVFVGLNTDMFSHMRIKP